ncbi:MAG: T9SS type A sorting domain-containing protein [bacterium]
MHSKPIFRLLTLMVVLGTNLKLGYALHGDNVVTISASEMKFSRNVTIEGDHVVLWGLGARYAWVAYPLSSVPFSTFTVEVEVSADTAANRWPMLGLAFNDSSNLQIEKQLTSVAWQNLSLGQFTPGEDDSVIYFSFTNDYYNPKKNQDLNLRMRKVTFQEVKLEIPASEMKSSRNVTIEGDHVVLWGLGAQYAWVAYPLSSVPFSTFTVVVEVSADTAANRWPMLGLAFNDSSNLQIEKQLTSVAWQNLSLGQFTPGEDDSVIYFSFTNDYYNPEKNQDLNLRMRKVTFLDGDMELERVQRVRVSWNPNVEPDLAGYRVYYGTSSKNYSNHIDVGPVTEMELSLEPHDRYYFAVQAYDLALNESLLSEEVKYEFEDETEEAETDEDVYGARDAPHVSSALILTKDFALAQNYPNPFNLGTTIHYQLPTQSAVRIEIFNLSGQKIRSLVNEVQADGIHSVHWDGLNNAGLPVASGVYLYRMQAQSFVQTHKMLLLK